MTDTPHTTEPSPEEAEYPPLLLITADSQEATTEREIELAERFEQGEQVPHLLNFDNPEDLRKLLTQRRLEVLRSIKNKSPASIRRLAERLDRNPSEVAADVNLLADYGIVYFRQEGRAKSPFVPYDEVTIEVDMLSTGNNHRSSASA
jgi:predicted transcriptional regulator